MHEGHSWNLLLRLFKMARARVRVINTFSGNPQLTPGGEAGRLTPALHFSLHSPSPYPSLTPTSAVELQRLPFLSDPLQQITQMSSSLPSPTHSITAASNTSRNIQLTNYRSSLLPTLSQIQSLSSVQTACYAPHLQWIIQIFSSNFLPTHPITPALHASRLSVGT